MAHDIFISHANADKTIADMVCATLEQHGLRCWMAPRDIRPGADWGSAIVEAIRESRVMVVVFSDAANASVHMPREIERAIGRQIPIVPVRLENVEPRGSLEYSLSSVHWLDAISPPMEAHILRLATTLRSILGMPPESAPAPAPVLPREPVQTQAPPPVAVPREPAATAEPLAPVEVSSADKVAKPLPPGIAVGLVALLFLVIAGVFTFWPSNKETSVFEGYPAPSPSPSPAGPTLPAASVPTTPGTYLVLQVATQGARDKPALVSQVQDVVRRRMTALGIADPVVRMHGQRGDELYIVIPDGVDAARAKSVIRSTAVFEMKLLEASPAPDRGTLLASHGGKVPETMEVISGVSGVPGDSSSVFYLVHRATLLGSRDIAVAKPTMDELGLPAVKITLSPEGVVRFERVSGENIGRQIAIILDGRVMSAPVIRDKVSGPEVQITGSFTRQEAIDLASVLTSGALPATITIVEEGREK